MERDLFLTIIALILCALLEKNLLWSVAVVDLTDRLLRLVLKSYIATCQSRKVKRPSSSGKRNGRLRKRS
ncbi:MAG: hypothetical protein J1E64_10440 [Acetatifactor sp.]|nr:hypothetical protein [Acetatifactor sp.]